MDEPAFSGGIVIVKAENLVGYCIELHIFNDGSLTVACCLRQRPHSDAQPLALIFPKG